MKKLKNRFKNIKPQTLLTHVIVTLLYPLARVVMASSQRLLIFTDCLTIVAAHPAHRGCCLLALSPRRL